MAAVSDLVIDISSLFREEGDRQVLRLEGMKEIVGVEGVLASWEEMASGFLASSRKDKGLGKAGLSKFLGAREVYQNYHDVLSYLGKSLKTYGQEVKTLSESSVQIFLLTDTEGAVQGMASATLKTNHLYLNAGVLHNSLGVLN